LQKEQSFNSESLVNYINQSKDSLGIDFETESYKNDIIEAVCVLIQVGLEYVYAHRSFQEYFTAKYIANLDDDGQKVILKQIINILPNSLNEDIVIGILSEINNNRLEKNFVIPILKELKEKVFANTNIETNYNFLKLLYSHVEHIIYILKKSLK